MANAYNTNQFPTATNQHVGGVIVVTCILDEDGFTYNAADTIISGDGLMNAGPAFYHTTAASKISKGNYVMLKVDTGVTYEACEGKPVVTLPATTSGICGKVISEPIATTALNQITATADADTLAERLAGKYYRIAQVAFNANACERVAVDGTDVLVGSDLLYDISAAQFGVGAGSEHGLVSAHYSTTAAEYVLAFYQLDVIPSQA